MCVNAITITCHWLLYNWWFTKLLVLDHDRLIPMPSGYCGLSLFFKIPRKPLFFIWLLTLLIHFPTVVLGTLHHMVSTNHSHHKKSLPPSSCYNINPAHRFTRNVFQSAWWPWWWTYQRLGGLQHASVPGLEPLAASCSWDISSKRPNNSWRSDFLARFVRLTSRARHTKARPELVMSRADTCPVVHISSQ